MKNHTSSPFMRALAAGVQANVGTLIWGEPGQAKTATVEAASRAWGYHSETVIGSNREASDFLGVMVETDGVVNYSSFAWAQNLIDADKGLLFLDEFNTSAPSTMKGMLRVVQERWVGEVKLPDSVAIIAAANPTETAVDAYDLPAPMANRLMHLDWVFDSAGWLDNVGTGFGNITYPSLSSLLGADPVSRKAAVTGAVTSFLRTRPNLLTPSVPTDPVKAGQAWPSPRSWTNVIEVLAQLDAYDDEAAYLIVTGLVGEGAATEYFAWLAASDLHDPAEVIDNPTMVNWRDERADRLFALVQAVTALGLSKPELWRKATLVMAACADGGKPDAAAPGAQKLMNNKPDDAKMPVEFRVAFLELFSATHNTVSKV
ncbi:AAA family ATPase [Arthrobacter sp. H14]|uniref:AAA family ATPase n=1 Tax=Arthrobacter sp. H14 TaxID=1312959 RepID=UPI0004AC9B51|nr:AAA family ATPase [Arthrobacter sp. H14]